MWKKQSPQRQRVVLYLFIWKGFWRLQNKNLFRAVISPLPAMPFVRQEGRNVVWFQVSEKSRTTSDFCNCPCLVEKNEIINLAYLYKNLCRVQSGEKIERKTKRMKPFIDKGVLPFCIHHTHILIISIHHTLTGTQTSLLYLLKMLIYFFKDLCIRFHHRLLKKIHLTFRRPLLPHLLLPMGHL